MKIFTLLTLTTLSLNAFADNQNNFIFVGHQYSENEFEIIDKNSFSLKSVEIDKRHNEKNDIGVFINKDLNGDFKAEFTTGEWKELNSGFVSLVIKKEDGTINKLTEIASFKAYENGCPFPRKHNPDGYVHDYKTCSTSQEYQFKVERQNGIIKSSVKNLNDDWTFFGNNINYDGKVNVGVNYLNIDSSNSGVKTIYNFILAE